MAQYQDDRYSPTRGGPDRSGTAGRPAKPAKPQAPKPERPQAPRLLPDTYKPGTKGGPDRSRSVKPDGPSNYGLFPARPRQGAKPDPNASFGPGGPDRSGTAGRQPKPPATTGGRSDTRVIPGSGGSVQTGTNMGKIQMQGLEEMERYAGGTIANFNGPSFPTQEETNKITDGYKFTGSNFYLHPEGGDGSAFQIPGVTGESTNIAVNGNTFRPQTYAAGAAGDIGGLDGFKPGGKFAGAPTATDGQTGEKPTSRRTYRADPSGEGIGGFDDEDMAITGPDPASYATSNQEARRRSAFLDASDSMQGLRDVERGMGMVYAGGNHYANVDGKMTQMDSDGEFSARNIKNQSESEAQALKDKWVNSLSAEKADEPQFPSSAQNPTVPSGTSTFTENNEIELPGDSKGIDYSNNNQESTGIAKPKVQFKPESFNINSGLGGGFGSANFNL